VASKDRHRRNDNEIPPHAKAFLNILDSQSAEVQSELWTEEYEAKHHISSVRVSEPIAYPDADAVILVVPGVKAV